MSSSVDLIKDGDTKGLWFTSKDNACLGIYMGNDTDGNICIAVYKDIHNLKVGAADFGISFDKNRAYIQWNDNGKIVHNELDIDKIKRLLTMLVK